MARHKQDGLFYFPFDTDFFYADKRIKRLHAKFGNDGLIFYIYLLTEIYRNGYYISWDEDTADDIATDLRLKEGFIEQVMTYLRGRSLLTESTLSTGVTIITSPGIQKRYQEAVKSRKRDVHVDPEIWILSDEETATHIKVTVNDNKSCVNDNKSCVNENKSCGNDIKESKVNKSKVKENICAEPEPPHAPPVISFTLNDKSLHDIFQSDIDAWEELYPAVDIVQELRKMKGWLDSNPTKRKTKRGICRFINSWLARTQDSGGNKGNHNNKKSKNEFCNFEQHDYDFDAIEKMLERDLEGG